MRQVQALLHTAELERFLVAHPNTFKRQKSEPSAGLKPAKRQRRQHWVCDQRHKSQVPVEVIVNLAHDGCLLKSSPMLSYHVLGWDDAMAVCAANRARGEIDLVMLPTPQLPQATMNTLRQIQGHSAALTPYEHPVCAPTDSPAGGGGAGGVAWAYLAVARSGAGPGLGCCGVERDHGLLLAADPVRR